MAKIKKQQQIMMNACVVIGKGKHSLLMGMPTNAVIRKINAEFPQKARNLLTPRSNFITRELLAL